MAAQDSGSVVITSTELDLMRVETVDGHALGHLFDLQADWPVGAHSLAVARVVYGKRGWMQRVGLKPAGTDTLPWAAVTGIEPGLLRVAFNGPPKRDRCD